MTLTDSDVGRDRVDEAWQEVRPPCGHNGGEMHIRGPETRMLGLPWSYGDHSSCTLQ